MVDFLDVCTYFRLIRRSKSFCPRAGVPVGVGVADSGTAPQSGSTLRPMLIDEGVPEAIVLFVSFKDFLELP